MLLYNVGKTGVMLAGPVIGLLYAVFLPFIGIAMTLVMIGKTLISGLVIVAVKRTSFGWRPIEAYLAPPFGRVCSSVGSCISNILGFGNW
jgi:hypothetical protein